MKKWFSLLIFSLIFPVLSGCEVSNTELANSLEGNMTRLVYSIGYLDSVSTEDLSGLVNNSSYFTHSSLYNGETANVGVDGASVGEGGLLKETGEEIQEEIQGVTNNNLNKTTTSGRGTFKSASFRTRTYQNGLENGNSYNPSTLSNASVNGNITTQTTAGGYSSGIVDMSLLETNAEDLNQILLDISTKRGIIMLYCTDLRSGRATLSAEDKAAISEYDDIIQETTNYLNNNTGALTNYFNGISSISGNENSAELINAKLIRANEVLKTRYAKLDTCLDSMDAIINILVNSIGSNYTNLYNDSVQYQTNNVNSNLNNANLNNVTVENANNEDIVQDETTEGNVINNSPSTTPNINPSTSNTPLNNNCDNCINFNQSNQNNYSPLNSSQNTPEPQQNYGIQTLPLTEKDYGDTIVNYNYDGNNSSSINNYSSAPNATTLLVNTSTPQISSQNQNAINETITSKNTEVVDQETASTYPLRNQTIVADELTETEIALNGGLVRHQNNEKITADNIDSFVATCFTIPIKSETMENEPIRPLEMARPIEKAEIKNDTKDIKEPPTNLFDEEFVESEKELTPDLLPFTGNESEPSTLEFRPKDNLVSPTPLKGAPELGLISLPFQYQEDNVLKKIPRT